MDTTYFNLTCHYHNQYSSFLKIIIQHRFYQCATNQYKGIYAFEYKYQSISRCNKVIILNSLQKYENDLFIPHERNMNEFIVFVIYIKFLYCIYSYS